MIKRNALEDEGKILIVDDKEYYVHIWGTTKGTTWARRCQEIIFKPIAAALGTSVTALIENDLSNININLESGFNAYLSSVDEKTYVQYLKELFVGVVFGNEEIKFETYFRGKLLHMHKLAYAIIQYQLGDFFDAARGGATKYLSQMQKKDSKISTMETSIG